MHVGRSILGINRCMMGIVEGILRSGRRVVVNRYARAGGKEIKGREGEEADQMCPPTTRTSSSCNAVIPASSISFNAFTDCANPTRLMSTSRSRRRRKDRKERAMTHLGELREDLFVLRLLR